MARKATNQSRQPKAKSSSATKRKTSSPTKYNGTSILRYLKKPRSTDSDLFIDVEQEQEQFEEENKLNSTNLRIRTLDDSKPTQDDILGEQHREVPSIEDNLFPFQILQESDGELYQYLLPQQSELEPEANEEGSHIYEPVKNEIVRELDTVIPESCVSNCFVCQKSLMGLDIEVRLLG